MSHTLLAVACTTTFVGGVATGLMFSRAVDLAIMHRTADALKALGIMIMTFLGSTGVAVFTILGA